MENSMTKKTSRYSGKSFSTLATPAEEVVTDAKY